MIFQDPMTSLNPTMTIGKQITEGILKAFPGVSKAEAKERALEALRLVGIPSPEERFGSYPHQFSGGMRQRVMIALSMWLIQLLVADNPNALDVTQAQILALLRSAGKTRDQRNPHHP